MTDLVANALKAADAFKDGNTISSCCKWTLHTTVSIVFPTGELEVIGSCLNKYREQKLIMAPGIYNDEMFSVWTYTLLCFSGSLPKSVKFFIEKAGDYLYGEDS